MKLWICEKPSQAKDIASFLKVVRKGNGSIDTNDGTVTWAFGHLMEELGPEAYGEEYKGWDINKLPIIPTDWKVGVKKDGKAQFNIIVGLIKKASEIIIATDPDAEGERIARNIILHAKYKGPLKRLWTGDTTNHGLTRAISQLKTGADTEGYFQASLARSRADWLIGMNYTRCCTLLGKAEWNKPGKPDLLRIGRVKTPTLWLVVNREREIDNFKPEDYFELSGNLNSEGVNKKVIMQYSPKVDDRIKTKPEIDNIKSMVENVNAPLSVIKSNKESGPPKLFSLNTLQKECGKKFGWSAQTTLDIAQALYEKHKATSYPRTDSNYLPTEHSSDVPLITSHLYKQTQFAPAQPVIGKAIIRKTVFDSKKVSAHYAIVPTTKHIDINNLNENEKKAYLLISSRFLQALAPNYKYENTAVSIEPSKGYIFKKTGNIPTSYGWKQITPNGVVTTPSSDNEEDNSTLPPLTNGSESFLQPVNVDKKTTKPPAYYTEPTLLDDMENVKKYVQNPKYKELLKEDKENNLQAGIGTTATRGNILEELKRGYLKVEHKKVRSTPLGKDLISLSEKYFPQLTKPEETAIWEMDIEKMRENKADASLLLNKIDASLRSDMARIQGNTELIKNLQPATGKELSELSPIDNKPIVEFDNYWKISGVGNAAKTVAGKTLTLDVYLKAIITGKAGPFEFTSKAGKPFKALIVFQKANIGKKGKSPFGFEFDEGEKKELSILSPINNEPIIEMDKRYLIPAMAKCEKIISGVNIPLEEYIKLATQVTVGPFEFNKKAGGTFKAWLTWNKKEEKIDFTFDDGKFVETEHICPKSKKPILDKGTWYQFPGYPKVQFKKEIAKRKMEISEFLAMLNNEETVLEGFVGKSGKEFKAILDYNARAQFPVGFKFPGGGAKKKSAKKKIARKRAKK